MCYNITIIFNVSINLLSDISIKESNKIRSPAYTFGSRHEKKATASAPAPNAYNTSGLNPRGKAITKIIRLKSRLFHKTIGTIETRGKLRF